MHTQTFASGAPFSCHLDLLSISGCRQALRVQVPVSPQPRYSSHPGLLSRLQLHGTAISLLGIVHTVTCPPSTIRHI